jgi:octaprenyl-diphosphate synthase
LKLLEGKKSGNSRYFDAFDQKMTEGELIQLTMLGRTDISEDEYFDILQRKRRIFFRLAAKSARFWAALRKKGKIGAARLRNESRNAFQLADDSLDFTAEEEVLGKASGADLLEGKLTFPLILLMRKEPAMREKLERIMRDGDYAAVSRESILESLEKHSTLAETRRRAYEFADTRENLEVLPETEYRLALEEIPSYMVERNK